MPRHTLEERVEIMEQSLEALSGLPAQVAALGSQIVQLRAELHSEISATHEQAAAGDDALERSLREEIRASGDQVMATLRGEIRASADQVMTTLRGEIRESCEQVMTTLRAEIRAGDDETRSLMRVLHEDVISRIVLLQQQARGTQSETSRPKPRHRNGRKRS